MKRRPVSWRWVAIVGPYTISVFWKLPNSSSIPRQRAPNPWSTAAATCGSPRMPASSAPLANATSMFGARMYCKSTSSGWSPASASVRWASMSTSEPRARADPLPPQVGQVADGAAVDQVLAHHPGQVTVARRRMVPIGDEADRPAAAPGTEQGGAGVGIRHVDLAGGQRRDHLAGAFLRNEPTCPYLR